jgi:Ca2+/Na+ antiporter
MSKIQKADSQARTRAFAITFAVILSGICVMVLFERNQARLADWFLANMATIADNTGVVTAVVSACFAPFYLIAGYIFLIGHRVIDSRRYPPPGQRVIRDTKIMEGHAAVTRGRLLKVLSIMLTVAVTATIVLFVYLVHEIAKAG